MELSRKYKTYLLRAKLKPVILHKTKKLCKSASDLELVIIFDCAMAQLKERGFIE